MVFKKIYMEFAQFNESNLDDLRTLLKESYATSSGPYGDLNTSLNSSLNHSSHLIATNFSINQEGGGSFYNTSKAVLGKA